MSLTEFTKQPLKPLPRISPSRYLSLQQCPLKEIWASSRQPLLPCYPAAYLGTAIHGMLELAFQGRITNREEISEAWNNEIERLEKEMLTIPVEKHLIPLQMSVFNFEVKKLLAFKMICSLFGDIPRRKSGGSKSSAEDWVQTPDGKVAGRIDLVKESDEGIEIVDYKTGPLSDDTSPGKPKEEYLLQVKMYAALYHAMHGVWPVKLSLTGLDQESVSIDVDSKECSNLLKEAEKSLDDINELIESGLTPEDFAQPSPDACKFCLYRPACKKYWESRRDDSHWPADAKGRIKEKTLLANGCFRIVIESDERDIAIRGLSAERHTFLKNDIKTVLFCSLGHDTSEGHYVEKLFTTGYGLE